MNKKIKTLALLLAIIATLAGCAPKVAPSTKSADNALPGIEAVMRAIKDQDFETLAAFDSNGQLLFETTSHEESLVNLSSELLNQFWSQDGALIMHNHPSGSTFSAIDLRAEAKRGTKRAVVVTTRDLYILEPGWLGWGNPDELVRVYEAYVETYRAESMANSDLRTEQQRIIWAHHLALTETAAEFGLSYRRIPLDEVFCFHGINVVTAG